jgi:hypothetical protein
MEEVGEHLLISMEEVEGPLILMEVVEELFYLVVVVVQLLWMVEEEQVLYLV